MGKKYANAKTAKTKVGYINSRQKEISMKRRNNRENMSYLTTKLQNICSNWTTKHLSKGNFYNRPPLQTLCTNVSVAFLFTNSQEREIV